MCTSDILTFKEITDIFALIPELIVKKSTRGLLYFMYTLEPRKSRHFGSQQNCPDKRGVQINESHLIDFHIVPQKYLMDGEASGLMSS
jgi:hypothetical protein